MCARCKTNPRDHSTSSYCRPCRNAHAAEYRLKARKRPTTEDRTCALDECEETFTWSSMHAKQLYCSRSHYSKGAWREEHPREPGEELAAGEKRCSKCKVVKSVLDFSPSLAVKSSAQCRACMAAYERAWSKANVQRRSASTRRAKARKLLQKYGAYTDDIDQIIADQGGVCKSCGGPPGLKGFHIDHHHETNRFRGLTCSGCNVGIGALQDDPAVLLAAVRYVAAFREMHGLSIGIAQELLDALRDG
jgi:hypothetical protein